MTLTNAACECKLCRDTWDVQQRNSKNNEDCANAKHMQEEGKVLNEEIIRATRENKVIAASDTSCKEEHMEGVWIVEDDFDSVSEETSVQTNKRKRNTAAGAEDLIVLDLVQTVA